MCVCVIVCRVSGARVRIQTRPDQRKLSLQLTELLSLRNALGFLMRVKVLVVVRIFWRFLYKAEVKIDLFNPHELFNAIFQSV